MEKAMFHLSFRGVRNFPPCALSRHHFQIRRIKTRIRDGKLTVESNNELLAGWVFESDFEISTIVILDAKISGSEGALSFRFLGIRYAPQRERFKYLTVYKGSGGNVSATQYGSECVQSSDRGSEDCLFLNLWTPYIPWSPRDELAKDLKPVMFSTHG
jgi:hypothetical protein